MLLMCIRFGLFTSNYLNPIESYNAVLSSFHFTYIEGAAGRTPMFPVKIWNHFDSAIEESPKTTNCCEGFYNTLNSVFHCSHPSVWYLFDGFRKRHGVLQINFSEYRSRKT